MRRYLYIVAFALLLPLAACGGITLQAVQEQAQKAEQVSRPRQYVATVASLIAATEKALAEDYNGKTAAIMAQYPADTPDRKAQIRLAGEQIRQSEAPVNAAKAALKEAGAYLDKAANFRSLAETRATEVERLADMGLAAANEAQATNKTREAENYWRTADGLLDKSRTALPVVALPLKPL